MPSDRKEYGMQYMLLIYDDEKIWARLSEDERNGLMDEYWAFTEEIRNGGRSSRATHSSRSASLSASATVR
jgi:hypothetical protein